MVRLGVDAINSMLWSCEVCLSDRLVSQVFVKLRRLVDLLVIQRVCLIQNHTQVGLIQMDGILGMSSQEISHLSLNFLFHGLIMVHVKSGVL